MKTIIILAEIWIVLLWLLHDNLCFIHLVGNKNDIDFAGSLSNKKNSSAYIAV